MVGKPAFLVTIDTEGDNLWSAPRAIRTENRRFLPRFQALCDGFGFKPTYLTNFEMAEDDAFVEWASQQEQDGRAEVGMHLHAWNSPPLEPLTADDHRYHPYLVEYPEAAMREKVVVMTDLLATKFGRSPTSHRAGRWGFDARYAQILIDQGYTVDCSIVPGVSFAGNRGDPGGSGGPDFHGFPDRAYRLDPSDIRRESAGGLLELPMTTISRRPLMDRLAIGGGFLGRVGRRLRHLVWLRPNGSNERDLLWLVDRTVSEKRPYIEFMLHSSELMPGGSPNFVDERAIETLYLHLETVFGRVAEHYVGETLTGYQQRVFPNVGERQAASG
jgi:hypothetical protein